MANNYYVYKLIDPRTSIPFYVGKGNGRRMYNHKCDALHNRNGVWVNNKPHHQRIRELVNESLDIVYEKILDNVSQREALKFEKNTIGDIGRVIDNTGPLLNISRGGTTGGETCKPVDQYSLEGKLIASFPSAKVASECVAKANRSYITQVCKGKRKSAGGYLWTYKGDDVPKFKKEYYSPVVQFDAKTKKRMNIFRSMTEAQKITGVELHNISEACRGNSKTAGGFLWRYA